MTRLLARDTVAFHNASAGDEHADAKQTGSAIHVVAVQPLQRYQVCQMSSKLQLGQFSHGTTKPTGAAVAAAAAVTRQWADMGSEDALLIAFSFLDSRTHKAELPSGRAVPAA